MSCREYWGKKRNAFVERLRRFFVLPPWLEQCGTRPWFGVLATLAIVFAGVCASLFTKEVRDSVVNLVPAHDSATGAYVFWLAVFIAGGLFWANLAAQTRKGDKARMDLDAAVKRLNTIPSETFLPAYSRCWSQASAVTFACIAAKSQGSLTPGAIDDAIRTVETAVLESAKDFDGASDSADYSSNIMLWRNNGEPPEDSGALNVARVAPHDPAIAGVLELVPSLSVTVRAQRSGQPGVAASPDTLTKSILLPVPEAQGKFLDDNGVEKLVLLPGAPLAFSSGECAVFPRMQEFIEMLRNGTTLDDRVKRRVINYFTEGEGKHIRSFGSFAILPPGAESALPIGVLNLHSNCAGILEDNGETLFAPVLAPFLSLLALLLSLRKQARLEAAPAAAPAPPGSPTSPNGTSDSIEAKSTI